MARLKGITITLINKKEIARDPLGSPIYEDIEIEVNNVLVNPTSAEAKDVIGRLNLDGRKAVYTLAIPKGDTNIWEGQEVIFFDKRWKVFGSVMEGIEKLIPLDWNKKVTVERYE